jgi:hypothetical protein
LTAALENRVSQDLREQMTARHGSGDARVVDQDIDLVLPREPFAPNQGAAADRSRGTAGTNAAEASRVADAGTAHF